MTPEERNLVAELFDRLATLENAQRDPEAERAIADGLRRAPNAVYALVQTVLVQDEALKQADAHIRELETELDRNTSARPAGFLDGMRETLFGRSETARAGSVPSVRPSDAPMGVPSGFRSDASRPMAAESRTEPSGQGGSFLGIAAAAAAGVIGGSLLLDGIRSTMGQRHGGFGAVDAAAATPARDTASPWTDSAGGDLARQAGLDDIGRGTAAREGAADERGLGLFDASDDDQDAADADFSDDFDIGGDIDPA